MSSKLKRVKSTYSFKITNSLATTAEINFEDEAILVLYTPAAWTNCTITVYGLSPVSGVGYLPLIDSGGNAVSFTAEGSKAIVVSEATFACTHIKLVSNEAANNALFVGATSKA